MENIKGVLSMRVIPIPIVPDDEQPFRYQTFCSAQKQYYELSFRNIKIGASIPAGHPFDNDATTFDKGTA